jgi:creatinine amidohydrolase
LAGRLARALGDALVAPVIRPGCSEHHLGFAGTITVPAEVLAALLDAYVDSLSRHGFERFLLFTSHGGNLPALTNWPGRRRPQQVSVLDDPRPVVGAIRQALSGFGAAGPAGRHADLGELLANGTRALSPSGVFGDPTSATAEMGAAVLAAWTQCLLDSLHPGASDEPPLA